LSNISRRQSFDDFVLVVKERPGNKSYDPINNLAKTKQKKETIKSMNTNTKLIGLFAVGLAFILSACDFKFSVGNTASMPPDAELQSLVKKTTSDFADAVKQGDFTTFHSTVSSDFQKEVSADKLKTAFAAFIEKKDLIVPLLKEASTTAASFSPAPVLRTENGIPVVDMNGSFPTAPSIKFQLSYEHETSGEWKLLKLNYKL
jgi:hypothetical protein